LLAILVGACLLISIGVGARQLMAVAPPSCGPLPAGSIAESKAFTPYALMRGQPGDAPINAQGGTGAQAPAGATSAVDGRIRQFTIAGANGAIYSYFLDRPIGSATPGEFLSMGGLQVEQEPISSEGSFATYLLAALGERATPVTIGQYEGVLTWADPIANGIRSHNVYWSDGTYNFTLIADRTADEIVGIARSLVCQS
jgi:hypothetical protein